MVSPILRNLPACLLSMVGFHDQNVSLHCVPWMSWVCPFRVERVETDTMTENIEVSIACAEDGDEGGISNRDVILILIGESGFAYL